MKYEQVWNAVDKLAKINGLSPSGLAKKAGLDSTTFNKSKRLRPDGKKRWPSLDSINKILDVCNMSFDEFVNLSRGAEVVETGGLVPYTKHSALFDTDIEADDVKKIRFPDMNENLYAIDIDTTEFEPVYRKGSIIVVSKNSEVRRGDRVVVMLENKKTLIGEFVKRTAKTIELSNLTNEGPETSIKVEEIIKINRIVWASQ